MTPLFAALVAVQYLSHALSVNVKPEEYTCNLEQEGYHILGKSECGLKIWKDSKRGDPLILDYVTAGECAYKGVDNEVRKQLFKAIGYKKREKHQQQGAFFTSQGERVTKSSLLTTILDAGDPLFFIEGGQFQWPPVEVGFKTVVEGIEVGGKPVVLETLAIIPPIFKVHNLASREETNALIKYAKPQFVKADVVYMDQDKGKDVNEFRTSLNYRPRHNETVLLQTMETRAASTTRMGFQHMEPVQILYYDKGGYYHAHDDGAQLQYYIKDKMQLVGHHYGYFDRMLTLFWYMNDVPEGGQTNFPRAAGPTSLPVPHSMRKCTQGIMVPPVAGQAVLWYNMYPRGQVTPYALHAACAVEAGEKYAINVWVHNKPYMSQPAEWDPDHPRVKYLEKLTGVRAGSDDLANVNPNEKQMKFVNKGASTVQIYWRGQELQLVVDALGPGETTSLNTFVGHSFVAKSGNIEVSSCAVTAGGAREQVCKVGGKTEF